MWGVITSIFILSIYRYGTGLYSIYLNILVNFYEDSSHLLQKRAEAWPILGRSQGDPGIPVDLPSQFVRKCFFQSR